MDSSDHNEGQKNVSPKYSFDPITLEVIRGAFTTIADEIDTNLARTAYSMLIYEYKDYAVGILDAAGNLICQCTGGMPIFIADVLGAAVRDGLEIYGREGAASGRCGDHKPRRDHGSAPQQCRHVQPGFRRPRW